MAFKKKRRKSVYPTQDDTTFLVQVLNNIECEVRTTDREDYEIVKMGKTLINKITRKGKDDIPIGNVYKVTGEDILLGTEAQFAGLLHAESLLNKVVKKNLVSKVDRTYGSGGEVEIYNHPTRKPVRFTDRIIETYGEKV